MFLESKKLFFDVVKLFLGVSLIKKLFLGGFWMWVLFGLSCFN